MEFRILGPLEALDGDRIVPLPCGRGRALLALLVLHAGEVVATERLVDELWGDAPPTVQTALQGLVSNLRKRLEPARASGTAPRLLRTAPFGYVLSAGRTFIDAHRFRQLLEQAQHSPTVAKAEKLREALGLWRGPALADFTYEPFAQREIATLEELRLTAVEERLEADLALGRHAQLVAETEALVAEHPFRERLRGQLCSRCTAQAGRPRPWTPSGRPDAPVRRTPTEMPNLRADALVGLADVLLAGDQPDAAASAAGEAIEIYERKGNTVAGARARTRASS